ncbi:insulinase family protein [Saccharophagus sp. K07]|jgi:zinc protease|uniref:M16 family metallopeptidase n=1 Tax=Saccharophagus sp. K07 TaxID=2283636 RepID=UPI00165273F8|nr:pitrilysin family protein [Saccharophagus sp. K07]MBC6904112.1 insulinase family protein [Saccharophagus sp. K07]
MLRSLLSLFAVLLLAAASTTAKLSYADNSVPLPRGVEKVVEVEGITEYRLKNGLTVLLFPDSSQETVTVNVTYKVGSKHESYGETGMAHLLEHLLFKGSKKHPDIPGEMSARGAEANGTTWLDRTNYYETFTATEDNIDWALRMEADRMVNSFIAKKDLDSEMTVVRNEFERAENNPLRVLMQRMSSSAYLWHNNGKPSIGARSDIENVSIERLQDFYRRYYQPDNAVLTVAGKFNEASLLKLIQKHFGKIPRPKRQLTKLYTAEPAQDGERSVTVRRVGDIQWFAAAYHIPAGSHPDYPALEVLTEILADTPRGRLHKGLVETKLAVSAFGYPYQLQDPGLLFFGARVEKGADLEKTRTAFLQLVEGVAQTPITDDEVARAKRNLLKHITLAFNSSEQIAIALSEYIGMGDWRLLFLTRDRIEEVTAADVQRVATQYLVRNNRTEGRFYPTTAPERVDIPVVADVAAMLEGYKGREIAAAGEEFDPSLENISTLVREHSLPAGAKIAFLPRKTRGESVILNLNMQYGSEKSLWNQSAVASLTGAMLMRGTRQYDRQALQDRLDELQANASIGGRIMGAYASVLTTKANLADVVAVVAEVLRNPVFDTKEFELLKSSAIANLEASRQDPQSIAGREARRFYSPWPPGHPYYAPTLDEEIAELRAVTIDDLKRFHKEFYGANQMQIAIVGDFDEQEILVALKEQFGEWRSSAEYVRILQPYRPIDPVTRTFATPDKENAVVMALMPVPVGENHPDAAALQLSTYIFGGGFLNSRLTTRLRQQDGLSYSSSAWVVMSNWTDNGQFTSYAIFAPQNRAAVEKGLREELGKILSTGFTAAEVKAAKSGMLQEARVARTQNENLAEMLARNLEVGRDIQWLMQREAQLQALTPQQLLEALRRHVKAEDVSFIWAGDFRAEQQPTP